MSLFKFYLLYFLCFFYPVKNGKLPYFFYRHKIGKVRFIVIKEVLSAYQ